MIEPEPSLSAPPHDLSAAIQHLFRSLRAMDAEASDVAAPSKSGLQWYGSRHQAVVKNRWLRELRKRLSAAGFNAEANALFPHSPARCELLLQCGREKLWLKVLGIWKEYARRIGMPRSYRSALFHPLLPNTEARTNSAPNCLSKLTGLKPENGHHAGLLLIGFDSVQYSLDEEIQQFATLSGVEQLPWARHTDQWITQDVSQARTALWLWVK